jgi:hypothetical protein
MEWKHLFWVHFFSEIGNRMEIEWQMERMMMICFSASALSDETLVFLVAPGCR